MKKKWLNIVGIFALFVAGSIGGQLGIEAARAAFWQWSKTAINNQTADPSINWSEGMSPSAVNDSARAMMARSAEQRDDVSGLLTTGGTATAYTVTTNQGIQTPTPQDGQSISVTMNVTNGANSTLSADSGTSYPIQSSPGTAVGSGTLVAGSPYTMKFSAANSAWMLRDYYSFAGVIPLGGMIPYTGSTSPNSNYVLPAGQCISTTTYAAYWALLGSPAPGACGAGTFAVIDLRGRVLVALDNLNGTAANRLTNAAGGCGTAITALGATCLNGTESRTISTNQMPSHFHPAFINESAHSHTYTLWTAAYTAAGGGTASAVTSSSASTSSVATGVRVWDGATLDRTGLQGGGQGLPSVQPTIGVGYLLRVL